MTMLTKAYATFGAMVTAAVLTNNMAFASDALTPVTVTGSVQPANSFSQIFERIAVSFGGITGLISMFAYLTGVIFAIAGILKIKDHVEQPDKTDLKAGAMRLVAGGALFAMPYVMALMQASIGEGGSVSAPQINAAGFGIK